MALTKITRGVIKANENYDTHNINSTGIVTAVSANFTGDVSIGGTLTYQDVTNIDSVGIITAQSDISIADKIVHTGDTNTALRFPAADTITAETGGTERLRITSAGNLGINKTPTTYQFEVNGGTANTVASFESTDATSRILFKDNSGEAMVGAVGDALTFYTSTNANERLRIDSSGRLNIGSSSAPGTVGGFSHINIHGTGINANGAIGLYRNSASPSAGQGIGAIYFANSDGNAGAYIQGQSDGTWGTDDYPGRLVFFTTADGASSSTERFRITSAGVLQAAAGVNLQMASNGRIFVGNGGNATDPMFANVSDTNTGIAFPAADTMLFTTGGSERLRIDSSGKILKGMTSSILGSSDVQLTGSGGPAKIAGYWSNNNPGANSNMLSIGGYSQSGSTFTGVGEIDFRCDQNNATSSGSHSGSILTRVNGGSTTGTHGGLSYSYAGLKDRERLTRRSKRYYCLPEVDSGSDTYNNFREEWDYHHYVGYNQYSWYRFTHHSSSSSRGGSVDIRVTWHTRHAAGNGYGHWAFHWRESHATGYMEIGNVYRYHLNYLNGSYYGWSSNPALDVYEINDNGNVGGFYLRVQGHVSANGNTYDGGAMHQFLISAHTNRYGADVNKFEFVGNSTPSDVGSIQGNVNLP